MKLSSVFYALILGTQMIFAHACDQEQLCATTRPLICKLDETASLILALIQGDSLTMMLENPNKETLELLITNFSPAEIAFQAEVLNNHLPTIALFVTPETSDYQLIMEDFITCAREFSHRCNFVEINTDKLFKIAQVSHVSDLPTLLFLHNSTEMARMSAHVAAHDLQAKIISFLEEAELIKHNKQE